MNTTDPIRTTIACVLLMACLALAACRSSIVVDPMPVLDPRIVQGEWLGIDSRVPGSATILLTIDEDGNMLWDQRPGSQQQTLAQPRVWRGRVGWDEEAWNLLFEREGEEPLRMSYQDGSLSTFTLHPLDRERRWTVATFVRLKIIQERLAETDQTR
ncbi:MAG: hypothetical protein ACIAS6_08080 [Phycisphaerales bacterium JB060]